MPINKVGTKGIADGSIATADLNDGLVTSAKLQNGAVTNVKLTNTAFTLSGTSISLGGSATFNNKFVDWQSVIVADGSTGTTGVSGRGYFINTTSAAHTFTLPSSATRGDNISIKDYAGTFATNNLTIARNGHNIQGVANNSLISTNRASVLLVYVDVTRGWEFVEESNVADLQFNQFTSATGGTILTDGNFKTHIFTGDGCFVVSQVGAGTGPSNIDYLVIAGGGGAAAGGGGAGGYRTTFPSPGCNAGSFPISATTYPITVGGGGAEGGQGPGSPAGPGTVKRGTSGSNSVFSTITSTGGGGGGSAGAYGPGCGPLNGLPAPTAAAARTGLPGGSGGGAGHDSSAYPGGTGNTPPVSPSQGNNGGNATVDSYGAAAGGGGAGAVGSNQLTSPQENAGPGGIGSPISTTFFGPTAPSYGTPGPAPGRYFAGGGGGGNNTSNPGTPYNSPTGGSGGGGAGAPGTAPAYGKAGSNGSTNTGGGGGGHSHGCTSTAKGGAGGSGIVVIRYKFQ